MHQKPKPRGNIVVCMPTISDLVHRGQLSNRPGMDCGKATSPPNNMQPKTPKTWSFAAVRTLHSTQSIILSSQGQRSSVTSHRLPQLPQYFQEFPPMPPNNNAHTSPMCPQLPPDGANCKEGFALNHGHAPVNCTHQEPPGIQSPAKLTRENALSGCLGPCALFFPHTGFSMPAPVLSLRGIGGQMCPISAGSFAVRTGLAGRRHDVFFLSLTRCPARWKVPPMGTRHGRAAP